MSPLLARLCAASGDWLMITRLPVVEEAEDFAVLQRPVAHGYRTEYAGWVVNRRRMLAAVQDSGFRLVRGVLGGEQALVPGGAEPCRYRRCLFLRRGMPCPL